MWPTAADATASLATWEVSARWSSTSAPLGPASMAGSALTFHLGTRAPVKQATQGTIASTACSPPALRLTHKPEAFGRRRRLALDLRLARGSVIKMPDPSTSKLLSIQSI